jgi:hypothetical protein
MIFNFDGKLSLGPLTLHWSTPFAARNHSVGFPGGVVREHLAEDDLPECTPVDPNSPEAGSMTDPCVDRGRAHRRNQQNFFERFGILEYKTRFSENRAGLTGKGYFIQFARVFDPITILNPIPQLLEGGLGFDADQTTYRFGANIDGDFELGRGLRLLYGAEGFYEWLPTTVVGSRQGAGVEATFPGRTTRPSCPCPARARPPGTRWRWTWPTSASSRTARSSSPSPPTAPSSAPTPRCSGGDAPSDPRRRRPRPGGADLAGQARLRSDADRLGGHRLRVHPRLARQAQLRPGLPPAGLQQHRFQLAGDLAPR